MMAIALWTGIWRVDITSSWSASVNIESFPKRHNLTIRCDYGGAPRDAHITVNQNAASVVQGILDEATYVRKVDKDVIVFRVLHGYNHVVRPLQRIVLARRDNVRDPKLSAEVDGLDGGETVRCASTEMLWKLAHRVAPDGGHALSDVELTIDDGVDVAGGCIRHDQGLGVVGGCGGEMRQT